MDDSLKSNWQKLGAVPQNEFDLALEQAEKPTTNGIIRATAEQSDGLTQAAIAHMLGVSQKQSETICEALI